MHFETCLILIPLLLILVVLLWFMNRSLDQDRLRGYIEFRGGRILDFKLLPADRNWWQQAIARAYEVRYLDADGHEHLATCTTGLFTNIRWTSDDFVRYADQVEGVPLPGSTDLKKESTEEENRRLREELARLKDNKGQST